MKSLIEYITEAKQKKVDNIVILPGGFKNDQYWKNLEVWVKDNVSRVAKLNTPLDGKDVIDCATTLYSYCQDTSRKNNPKITVASANRALDEMGDYSLGAWKGPKGEQCGEIISFEKPK